MQDIQDLALKNYEENMSYFEKSVPSLHNRLLALETLLDEGKYPQKYDLEYKDNYFDVIELQSNLLLYKQNSEEFSQKLCDEISYKKDEHTFKSYRKTNFDEQTVNFLKNQNAYTSFSTTAQVTHYYYTHTNDSMHMTQIEKFIFLGTGLGIHIPKIIQKHDIQVALIIEDDIELFRLSLFVTNYKETFQNVTPYFAINQTQTEFHKSFNTFFLKAFFKNQYIKFNLFSSRYEEKIEYIRSMLVSRPEASYSHERMLVKNKRVMDKIAKEYKFLDLQKQSEEKFFHDKPWLVLGAGPSLHQNTEWLLKNHQNFIIIAPFTALNTLKRIGVSPDIAVQIDENDFTTSEMIEKLGDLSFLDQTLIFFSASVSKLLFDLFDKDRVYLHEDRTKYKLAKSTLAVASVGETVYTLALLYNVSNIYLLGVDLALGKDGKTHSPDHFKALSLDKEKDLQEKDSDSIDDFQLADSIINVKGNFQDVVQTTPLFALSIPVINYKTKNHKSSNQIVYNLSDGAYFEHTVPQKTEELQLKNKLDKSNIYQELTSLFDRYSETSLKGKELQAFACREAQIQDYYDYLEEFNNKSHANRDIFLQSYINLVNSIINHSCIFELHELLTIYFLRVSAYVDDFVHTQEIKHSKRDFKKIKHFFLTQVKKIITTYEDDLMHLKKSLESKETL